MKTEIDFLRELEADLDRAARLAPVVPRARSSVITIRPSRRVLVFAAVAVLLLAGTIGYFVRSAPGGSQARLIRAAPANRAGYAPAFLPPRDCSSSGDVPFGSQKSLGGQPLHGSGSAGTTVAGQGGVPLVGPQIVKTGQLSLEVPKGHFDEAFRQASLVASKYGGFVDSSSSAGSGPKAGLLEIRVPSLSFDRAVENLAGLGKVLSRSVDATDVTAQYVDLQARVRTWRAQEDVLLKLMAKATTVQDTLRVQNELQDVQLQIERLQGQLRVLDDQTANGTISVSLREAGAPVKQQEQQKSSWLPSFRNAWHDAVGGLLSFVFAVMVGLAYLLPAALLALLAWLGYRQLRLRTSV